MTTALVPFEQMQTMAEAVAKSGLFGAKTPEQALTIMMLAQAEGRHPMSAAKDYDIINGKPSKKAEAMLRDFIAAGGKVEWHKLADDGAEATFSHPQGGTIKIDWNEARAKKAGLSAKEMYGKYPRAMYRSRCVSEGIRTIYPSATGGLYVPEEVRALPEKDMGKAEIVKPTRFETLTKLCREADYKLEDILAKAEVKEADDMKPEDFASAISMLGRRITNIKKQVASQG